jgi:hypothetical protein
VEGSADHNIEDANGTLNNFQDFREDEDNNPNLRENRYMQDS